MRKKCQRFCQMSPLLVTKVFAISILLVFFSCGQERGSIPPAPPYPFVVRLLHYDQYEPAPVSISIVIEFNNVIPPFQARSGRVSWGESDSWETIELPVNEQGYYLALTGRSINLTHLYSENGDYRIIVELTDNSGKKWTYPYVGDFNIRIGPYTRLFKDPRDGSEYLIYDGTVIVAFKDWERFENLDHDMAEEPDVRAFLAAENLKVRYESPHIGSMQVILPPETTVEEAVSRWPEQYPELIESVDPNSLGEPVE